ncbi:MAG: hypothetical protein AAF354_03745, partial [Pseudomonadota bacterium]
MGRFAPSSPRFALLEGLIFALPAVGLFEGMLFALSRFALLEGGSWEHPMQEPARGCVLVRLIPFLIKALA